jgi:hypothetical protein
MTVYAINIARMKARDTKRFADMRQLSTAIELYYNDYSTLPSTSSYGEGTSLSGCTGGWDCSHIDQDGLGDGEFMEFLTTSDILKDVPKDPLNDNSHHYKYYYYGGYGETYGCQRPFYVLVARGFEISSASNDDVCYTPYKGNDDDYVIIGNLE